MTSATTSQLAVNNAVLQITRQRVIVIVLHRKKQFSERVGEQRYNQINMPASDTCVQAAESIRMYEIREDYRKLPDQLISGTNAHISAVKYLT